MSSGSLGESRGKEKVLVPGHRLHETRVGPKTSEPREPSLNNMSLPMPQLTLSLWYNSKSVASTQAPQRREINEGCDRSLNEIRHKHRSCWDYRKEIASACIGITDSLCSHESHWPYPTLLYRYPTSLLFPEAACVWGGILYPFPCQHFRAETYSVFLQAQWKNSALHFLVKISFPFILYFQYSIYGHKLIIRRRHAGI